jgi:hypothetical protein
VTGASTAVNRPRGWRLQWLVAGLLVALALAAVALAQSSAGRSTLRRFGLANAPPRYTELSFSWPTKLPKYLLDGRSRHVVPFSVHNSEGRDLTYRWTVSETAGGRTSRLAAGSTFIAAGDRTAVAPRFDVACAGSGRVRVVIDLPDQSESIGWWAQCLRK